MQPSWLVNGRQEQVDPRDRGLAYGDGLFETMACHAGGIRWIEHHLDRVLYGCRRLAIPVFDRNLLRSEILSVCPIAGSAVIKLIVTRGIGERGYRAPEPASPTRIVSTAPWPEIPAEHYTVGVSLKTCTLRLGENPQLAGLKHLCRLEQVLAQMELAGSDAGEGLLRGSSGLVVGGITSNLFAVRDGRLLTPRVNRCGVAGVMRRVVLKHAADTGLDSSEADLDVTALVESEELFITNAVFGIKPVRALDTHEFGVGPTTCRLMRLLGYGPVT
ncbi:MAG: aminodeoxychorismate lyase [Gammaproteobacteria bacterium]|nr:aminodeoxychorismate lyase [Gammaproteobacteria bacterium]